MTTYNKTTLKTFFQTNDVPNGNDYANLIDSQINIVETALQSMAGPLQTTELNASRVSAGNANFTGSSTFLSDVVVSGGITSLRAETGIMTVDIDCNVSGNITANRLSITANISAATANFSSNVSADGAFYSQSGQFSTPINIAASGTTLGTANLLTTARINILTAATDGTATGIGLLANKSGLQQYVYNDTAVSANLWPCTGGQINNLASGAAFGMTTKTLYTIVHTKASGYAVK